MKIGKILFSIFSTAICVGASSYASAQPQMYIGAQGGYADTNFGLGTVQENPSYGTTPLTSATIKNHVFGGRGYLGYQFNDYVAVETGFLRVRNTRYTQINGGTIPNGDVSEYGIDISGKVFLPMAAYIHLSPYLKVGGIYIDAQSQGAITRNGANDFGYSTHPLFGAGIGYDIMPNLTADLSWTTIAKHNSSLPAIYMYFLGLTYHFSFEDVKSGGPNYGDANGTDP